MGIVPEVGGFPDPVGYTPDLLDAAYGIGNIKFGSVTGDGNGQTIAIVDAYDDPAFVNTTEPITQTAIWPSSISSSASPIRPASSKVNESGQTSPLPRTDPAGAGNINGNWEIEEALDIE